MTNRFAVAVWAAVLTAGTGVVAQTNPIDRFTFSIANADKAGLTGAERLQVTLNRWSTPEERDRVAAAVKEDRVDDALSRLPELGYFQWPGSLQYVVRYAAKSTEGGMDEVVLGFDQRLTTWWDPTSASNTANATRFSIVQLRLARDGRGEGKLSVGTNITVTEPSNALALKDWSNPATVLTEVRRERSTS
jgi:hypothetical protein